MKLRLMIAIISVFLVVHSTNTQTEKAHQIKDQLELAQKSRMSKRGNGTIQKRLHQAILNNSAKEVADAIKAGANINKGIGNQPPLLLAFIIDKTEAVNQLLDEGADPNIRYQNQSLIKFAVLRCNFNLANKFIDKGVKITPAEKKEIISLTLFTIPCNMNQDAMDLLKKLGYTITDNFKSTDLQRNKWYQLLVRHFTGISHGKPFGHTGLPSAETVQLFLKNGALPNQIFKVKGQLTTNPLFLILDNYIGLGSKKCDPEMMKNLLQALVEAGAEVNMEAEPVTEGKKASPLSFILQNDDSNCVVDILVNLGANIENAIKLYLDNGGDINKKFRYWQKFDTWNLLSWAIENNNPKAVDLLVKSGVYKDASLIKDAIEKGNSEIINILMSDSVTQ